MSGIYLDCESWKRRAEQAEAERDHWKEYTQELKRDVLRACLEVTKLRDQVMNAQASCAILEGRLTQAESEICRLETDLEEQQYLSAAEEI